MKITPLTELVLKRLSSHKIQHLKRLRIIGNTMTKLADIITFADFHDIVEALIFFFNFFPLFSGNVLEDKVMIDDFNGNLFKVFLIVALIESCDWTNF